MKIKMFMTALLLAGGVSAFAQADKCNSNSSISHEAVKAKNYADAYLPCMAVLKDCPTLKYYTYKDAEKILTGLMSQIKDHNSADYKKYFDELMWSFDLKMKYIPEFASKLRGVPGVDAALGSKAVAYLQYAPKPDLKQAYEWLKQSVDGEKENSDAAVLFYFVNTAQSLLKNDPAFTNQFIQDYLTASKYIDEEIATCEKENKKAVLQQTKESIVGMFINSGVADCETLQNVYGPKIEEHKTDSAFLAKTVNILKMVKCTESKVYFEASAYLYQINPTVDAAIGCAYMYYKKGDYNSALKYFDEALNMEQDSNKRADICYATAAALMSAKKFPQAKAFCLKAIANNEKFGDAYILLAQLYGANPNWSDEPALNKCTYFVVVDKLQRAKQVDPSVTDKANELISSYSRHFPQAKDLFMLGHKTGDKITIGGWIGETTTIR